MKVPVVALGTFDGVHLGHQTIISSALKFAAKNNLQLIVVTFDPHPQQVICPERGLKLLTTLEERKELIPDLRILKFDENLRRMSSDAFIEKYIVKKFNASQVFVGYDYAFGEKREGSVIDLKKLGKKHGFGVTIVKAVKIKGKIVKSRNIRELISSGKFNQALRFLGHPYQITGKVVKGQGRGRNLGFPTANLKVDAHKLIPAHGVYAGRVGVKKCAINIGARPTFGTDGVAIEVHIINFKRNILGKTLKVDLCRRLRDERQFSDVEELKEQIRMDIEEVKRI